MKDENPFFEAILKHRLIVYLKKYFKVYFLFTSIFIFFKSLIESGFENLIVNPFFSKIEQPSLFLY